MVGLLFGLTLAEAFRFRALLDEQAKDWPALLTIKSV